MQFLGDGALLGARLEDSSTESGVLGSGQARDSKSVVFYSRVS
jgi:hypothetical protein